MSRTFTPECPCGNGCTGSHDSRAFGPASCVVCLGDICDFNAFAGAVVCVDCIEIQSQISGVGRSFARLKQSEKFDQKMRDEHMGEELVLDDWEMQKNHFGASYQPTSEEVMAVLREENPDACCDWHSQPEASKNDPCAAWQGGSNFAPNFGEDAQGEGEFDFENALFAAHIHHLIDTDMKFILQLVEGWQDLDCPSCGNRVEFERDGNGVRADCFHCEVGSSLRWVFP